MSGAAEAAVAYGVPHRAWCALVAWRFDWDELGVTRQVLPDGAVFQPWPPSAHAARQRVPISLGQGSAGHGWDAAHPAGLFLRLDDVRRCCRPLVAPPPDRPVAPRDLGVVVTAFDELPAIVARHGVGPDVAARLVALAEEHRRWAEYELAAAGFDNVTAMREGAAKAGRALEDAQRLLRQVLGR